MGDRTLDIRKRLQPVFDQFDHFVSAFEPGLIRVVLGIVNQLRPFDCPAEIRPMMENGHDDQVATIAAKDT